MKKLLLLLVFGIQLLQAQDIEESQEGYFFSENTKNFFRVEITKPYSVYRVASCEDAKFQRAQFDGGDAAFSRELFRYISAYVDKEIYVINGPFFLHLNIGKDGKLTDLEVTPKVENSEMFLRDLKFAVKKIRKNWDPAKCNNMPVDSRLRIKLNFITESADI